MRVPEWLVLTDCVICAPISFYSGSVLNLSQSSLKSQTTSRRRTMHDRRYCCIWSELWSCSLTWWDLQPSLQPIIESLKIGSWYGARPSSRRASLHAPLCVFRSHKDSESASCRSSSSAARDILAGGQTLKHYDLAAPAFMRIMSPSCERFSVLRESIRILYVPQQRNPSLSSRPCL